MKKLSLVLVSALVIVSSVCPFLYSDPFVGSYFIYKVTKIGLSYTGADSPDIEISLSQTFDYRLGGTSQFYASDNVIYRGEISNGTITGIWVYYTDIYSYDSNGNVLTESHTPAWIDFRPGLITKTNLSIAVSENERAKIITDYSSSGFGDTKEAL